MVSRLGMQDSDWMAKTFVVDMTRIERPCNERRPTSLNVPVLDVLSSVSAVASPEPGMQTQSRA
jgi:hypothetical protein